MCKRSTEVLSGDPLHKVFRRGALLLCILLLLGACKTGPDTASNQPVEQSEATAQSAVTNADATSEKAPVSSGMVSNEPSVATLQTLQQDIARVESDFLSSWSLDLPEPQIPAPLTSAQREADFEALYAILSEDYPFFGVEKRRTGVDWRTRKEEYVARVRACADDEAFFEEIAAILDDLHNDHTKLCGWEEIESVLEHYSYYADLPSIREEYLALNLPVVRDRYNVEGQQPSADANGVWEDDPSQWVHNLFCQDLVAGRVGYIVVPEMLSETEWGYDQQVLQEYLQTAIDYPALVVDIRQNPGGLMEYWLNFLAPTLADRSYRATNWLFFRGGAPSRRMLHALEPSVTAIAELPQRLHMLGNRAPIFAHREDLKEFSWFYEDDQEVAPLQDGPRFHGRLYLLVDDGVYSAAEAFASFAKQSGFAQLIGRRTGGDGITMGMLYRVLPNSGLVFTYPNALGYSQDGKINEEEKTEPDVVTSDPIGWVLEREASLQTWNDRKGEKDE
uniref:S41 family peptidase n=1 Tax=Ndongobacter massiliensis TaxID=1871025 RepID=UPI000931A6B4|nr:S41 family peptidase [Ndongobacter massiliensis]